MPITKATAADVTALTRLVNGAYRGEAAKKGWTTESDLLDGQRIDEETMSSYFENDRVTILKNTDEAGSVTACVYLEKKGDKLYLGMLSVSPELQAAGIGKALLSAAEDHAREQGCNTMSMTVITSRHELISYYERRGYVKTGELVPFHHDEKFGIPRHPIELAVLEKPLTW